MEIGFVIITAPDVDVKLVNRLLLTIRDWEFGGESTWDSWKILRTIDEAFRKGVNENMNEDDIDKPPLQNFSETEWKGMSVEQIEQMMLLRSSEGSDYPHLFVLLDEKGIQDETIIVAHRRINNDVDGPLYLDQYEKTRVPWIEAWSMWVNLSLANMLFVEFCDQEKGHDDEGWLIYKPIQPAEHYAEFLAKRDAVVEELEKLDLA